MGGSASKSESSSDAGFKQEVWGPQGEALEGLYNQIGNLFSGQMGGFDQPYGIGNIARNLGMGGNISAIEESARPSWENFMHGGQYMNMDLANRLGTSLDQSMQGPTATQEIQNMIMGGEGNTYADAMRNQYIQDATRAQENMLQNLDARAAASGMSGGSRHGVATAQGMEDINRNLQRNMADVGYQTFDKDLDRKLQIAQQADQATLARQGMMQDMLGRQSDMFSQGLQMAPGMQNLGMGNFAPSMTAAMAPWQMASQYGNIIGRPTILGSGTMSGDSKGLGLSGGVGGGK